MGTIQSRRQRLQGLTALQNEQTGQITHIGLWLERYLVSQETKDDGGTKSNRCSNTNEGQGKQETTARATLIKDASSLPLPQAYALFYDRWQREIESIGAVTHIARTKGRMIVGLGDESVLETSIQLHHTYGVPYIPGSALKGLAASYASQQLGIKRDSPEYRVIFGTTDEAGFITFFDALYIPGTAKRSSDEKERVLYPDVITVHHRDYYQDGKTAPTDTDSPNPIAFLSATGHYLIALAAPDLEPPQRERWLRTTSEILACALKLQGIGAKTSNGYGRMELELQDFSVPIPPSASNDHTSTPPATIQPSALVVDPIARKIEVYIQGVQLLTPSELAGQIGQYHTYWKKLLPHPQSRDLAQAIINKIRQTKREKKFKDKKWYQELLQAISE